MLSNPPSRRHYVIAGVLVAVVVFISFVFSTSSYRGNLEADPSLIAQQDGEWQAAESVPFPLACTRTPVSYHCCSCLPLFQMI
jgi:hypothetical protein